MTTTRLLKFRLRPHEVVPYLTAYRKSLGMTQKELASRLGVGQPWVSKIERNKGVTIPMLKRWAGALGLEVELVIADGGRDGAVPVR